MKNFYIVAFLTLGSIFLYRCSDYPSPYVISFSPSNGSTGVAISTSISFVFNKKMNPEQVTTNISDNTCSGTVQVSADSFSTCVRILQAPVASNDNKTYTITPRSNLTGSTTYTIKLTSGIEDENRERILTTSSSFTTVNNCGDAGNYCVIFVSATTTNGDMDVNGNDNNTGIEEADVICNNDANKPNSSTFKAMVTQREERHKDSDGWVLLASTEYRRSDNVTVIGSTTSGKIFSFSLINSISDSADEVWTGLIQSWGKSEEKCGNGGDAWNTGNTEGGTYGVTNLTTAEAISNLSSADDAGLNNCSQLKKLYCVEQP